ncbi:MAG: DNA mismatch repair endonuclease MutL [Alistipes putredinis]|nr:MAG: DNA mismatch repair endonuclease MutL [Alistipes putredinis]
MENAVDAGSKIVTVNFRDGGKELIQVVDDGCGMSPMDARMAFDRHPTSKITEVEDIYKLMTFGFRGEALASIAAVAQVELLTRQQSKEIGTHVNIEGGKFTSQQPAACSSGAQFFVRNLFYNVPARRRFLDKSTTEAAHITAEFQRVALCHPEVAFQTLQQRRTRIRPARGTAQTARHRHHRQKHRREAARRLGTDFDSVGERIHRFAGIGPTAHQGAVSVRKRPLFQKARISTRRFCRPTKKTDSKKTVQPSYFIYLAIDPESIDVNVHPQKTEIKFSDNISVWQIINAAVRETLAKTGVVPLMDFDAECRADLPVMTNDKNSTRTLDGAKDRLQSVHRLRRTATLAHGRRLGFRAGLRFQVRRTAVPDSRRAAAVHTRHRIRRRTAGAAEPHGDRDGLGAGLYLRNLHRPRLRLGRI